MDKDGKDDFRIRVAREKRERMRRRLHEAAVEVFSTASLGRNPVIEDVISQAGVSRGTFYKYYDSLDALLTEVGSQVARETLEVYETLFFVERSSMVNLFCGPMLSLAYAGMEPARALITARLDFVDYFSTESKLKKIVGSSLMKAMSEGSIYYDSLDVAIDFVVGATLEGMGRSARLREVRKSYVWQLTAMIAAGLKMRNAEAEEIISESWNVLLEQAGNLSWWYPERIITTE